MRHAGMSARLACNRLSPTALPRAPPTTRLHAVWAAGAGQPRRHPALCGAALRRVLPADEQGGGQRRRRAPHLCLVGWEKEKRRMLLSGPAAPAPAPPLSARLCTPVCRLKQHMPGSLGEPHSGFQPGEDIRWNFEVRRAAAAVGGSGRVLESTGAGRWWSAEARALRLQRAYKPASSALVTAMLPCRRNSCSTSTGTP